MSWAYIHKALEVNPSLAGRDQVPTVSCRQIERHVRHPANRRIAGSGAIAAIADGGSRTPRHPAQRGVPDQGRRGHLRFVAPPDCTLSRETWPGGSDVIFRPLEALHLRLDEGPPPRRLRDAQILYLCGPDETAPCQIEPRSLHQSI